MNFDSMRPYEVFPDTWLGDREWELSLMFFYLKITEHSTDPEVIENRVKLFRKLGIMIDDGSEDPTP